MSNAIDTTKTFADPFQDPVSYLSALGVEAELVEGDDRSLPAAA